MTASYPLCGEKSPQTICPCARSAASASWNPRTRFSAAQKFCGPVMCSKLRHPHSIRCRVAARAPLPVVRLHGIDAEGGQVPFYADDRGLFPARGHEFELLEVVGAVRPGDGVEDDRVEPVFPHGVHILLLQLELVVRVDAHQVVSARGRHGAAFTQQPPEKHAAEVCNNYADHIGARAFHVPCDRVGLIAELVDGGNNPRGRFRRTYFVPLIMLLTVEMATPARFATSLMVDIWLPPCF